MANNRLYLRNIETNEHILIAKSFGGWDVRIKLDNLQSFLKAGDFESACYGTASALVIATEADLPKDSKQFLPEVAVYFPVETSQPALAWFTRVIKRLRMWTGWIRIGT